MMRALYVYLATFLALALTAAAQDRVVCYYGSWARWRVANGKVTPDDMDPSLCTHFIWSFALLNDNAIQIREPSDKDNLRALVQLRQRNPSAKILVAVGGWTDSQKPNNKYSLMAASQEKRRKFIDSVVSLLNEFKLDGFDVDWEYPKGAADKANFVSLLTELRERFHKGGHYLLTAAVGAPAWRADDSYNIPAISKQLDFINLMTYDFRGNWEAQTGHHANLRGDLSVESCVKHWLDRGCPRDKLVVGVPTYGQTWTLSNSRNRGIAAPAQGKGIAGPYTKAVGTLGYNEICEGIKKGEWKIELDGAARAPFAYKGNQWVSYDNVKSVMEKANYIKQLRLGGAMIWAIETDDTRGACGEKYPILKALNAVLRGRASIPEKLIPPTVDEILEEPFEPEFSGPDSHPDPGQKPNGARGTGVCTQQGNIPDPSSCGYFTCVNDGRGSFIRYNMPCPPGLCYNGSTNQCDHRKWK